MKKALIAILVLAVLLLGWNALRNLKMEFHEEKGVLKPVKRGDLTIPINATGEVRYESRTEIKSEASGTVQERFFEAGDWIRAGKKRSSEVGKTLKRGEARINEAGKLVRKAVYLIRQGGDVGSNGGARISEAAVFVREALEDVSKACAEVQTGKMLCSEADGSAAEKTLLIRLDPEDELRTVDRAQADLISAMANLEQAKITVRECREVGVPAATARLDGIGSQLERAKFELDEIILLRKQNKSNARELMQYKSSYNKLLADEDAAEAQVEKAKIAIKTAVQNVVLAGARFTTAEKNLSDAIERLRETEIFSPIDGMIVEMRVEKGEVIQAGKGSFTGGTVLAVVADTCNTYVRAEVDEADFGVVFDLAPEAARPHSVVTDGISTNGPKPPPVPIKTTQPVKVQVEAYPKEEFIGEIRRIYPEPRKAASVVTYFVDILVTGENRHLLQMGMQADVAFTAESVHDALLVRHDAIHKEDEQFGVYVPEVIEGQPDPEPKFVPCRFSIDNGLFAAVASGEIKEGDMVYTKLPHSPEEDED